MYSLRKNKRYFKCQSMRTTNGTGSYLEKVKQIKISTGVYSILLNIVIFSVLLILFEPTLKSDDYDMTNLLYGGFDGEYSPFILYIHVFLGYLMKGLLILFPEIPWYYVLGFAGMVLAFSAITFVFIKRGLWKEYRLLIICVLTFLGYEFYIRTTFSKTAGIMIISGLIFLLYLIEEEKKFNLQYICAIFLTVVGTMIRNMMFIMLLGVAIACFIIFCVENRQSRDKLKKGAVRFVTLSVVLFIVSILLDKSNSYLLNSDEDWAEYQKYNATRAVLFDYSWPDYFEFQDEYDKLGVSENDYKMWAELANITDPDILTLELMEQIRDIEPIRRDKSIIEAALEASKSALQYLANNLVFYIFLSSCVLLLMTKQKKSLWKIALIFSLCLGVYYYLFYRGRVQHHVDAALFAMGTVLVLYYYNKECEVEERKMYKAYLPVCVIFLSAVLHFYDEFVSSSYYGTAYGIIPSQRKQYEDNYERMSLLSKDKEHIYIMGAYETNIIYPCFNVFQAIEKEFYSNIYRMNQYTMIEPKKVLQRYGIKNESPLSQIVNSEKIRYCISEERLSELDIIEKYIQEHYDEDARSRVVDEIEGIYIYEFISE